MIPLLFAAWFAWYYRYVIAGEEHQLLVWFVVAAIAMHALHDLRGPLALPSLFALY